MRPSVSSNRQACGLDRAWTVRADDVFLSLIIRRCARVAWALGWMTWDCTGDYREPGPREKDGRETLFASDRRTKRRLSHPTATGIHSSTSRVLPSPVAARACGASCGARHVTPQVNGGLVPSPAVPGRRHVTGPCACGTGEIVRRRTERVVVRRSMESRASVSGRGALRLAWRPACREARETGISREEETERGTEREKNLGSENEQSAHMLATGTARAREHTADERARGTRVAWTPCPQLDARRPRPPAEMRA